jgi:Leucine-rich repeat (LRR) protein
MDIWYGDTEVSLTSRNLKQLPSIDPNCTILRINNNKLTKIDISLKYLSALHFSNNLVEKIDNLSDNLKFLSCNNNPITQLPPLPKTLEWIWISPWQLECCLNDLNSFNLKIRIIN